MATVSEVMLADYLTVKFNSTEKHVANGKKRSEMVCETGHKVAFFQGNWLLSIIKILMEKHLKT